MGRAPVWLLPMACLVLQPVDAADRKLTSEERIELIRGLTAEQATAKTLLPRSKKPLVVDSKGTFDQAQWEALAKANGPAARAGDVLQITKVNIEDDRIVFEINGGSRSGPKWYERIQVGTGGRTSPVGSGSGSAAPAGTNLALVFPGQIPPLTAAETKKMLAPVLDFNIRSAAESTSRLCRRRCSRPSKIRKPWRAWIASRSSWPWGGRTTRSGKPWTASSWKTGFTASRRGAWCS